MGQGVAQGGAAAVAVGGAGSGRAAPRSCKCTEGLLAATTWATRLLRTEVSEAGRPTPTRGLLPAVAAPSCA